MELALGSREKGKSCQVVKGYTIELKKVAPYPEDSNNIAPEDYSVELVVSGQP